MTQEEIKIAEELEKAYSEKNIILVYEMCSKMYRYKTGEELGDIPKQSLTKLLNLNNNGIMPSLDIIEKTLQGLIELFFIPKQ